MSARALQPIIEGNTEINKVLVGTAVVIGLAVLSALGGNSGGNSGV